MQSITTWKVTTDDILKECDTINDDMEVDTETNIDATFEENVKQVEVTKRWLLL